MYVVEQKIVRRCNSMLSLRSELMRSLTISHYLSNYLSINLSIYLSISLCVHPSASLTFLSLPSVAHQRYPSMLQVDDCAGKLPGVPDVVGGSVDEHVTALVVPEPTLDVDGAVLGPGFVVVAVVRRELHAVRSAVDRFSGDRVAGGSVVAADVDSVLAILAVNGEIGVLRPVPASVDRLQFEVDLVLSVLGEVVDDVVAEPIRPVGGRRVSEARLEFCPGTVEAARHSIVVLKEDRLAI